MLENISQVVQKFVDSISKQTGEVTRIPIPGPHEDVSDFSESYPLAGTSLGTSNVPEVVAAITELKQEAAEMVRARVIEFKAVALAKSHFAATFTRIVRKADKAALAEIKADIEAAVQDGVFQSTVQAIIPTLRVRPGYVYVNI